MIHRNALNISQKEYNDVKLEYRDIVKKYITLNDNDAILDKV